MAIKNRRAHRDLLHRRIRKKISGTAERPRLAVSFSGKHVYAQIIEDTVGHTLASVCTTEKSFRDQKNCRANQQTAEAVGKLIAERAQAKEVKRVVFDRGGFKFHGKVKALAEAARAGGLEF